MPDLGVVDEDALHDSRLDARGVLLLDRVRLAQALLRRAVGAVGGLQFVFGQANGRFGINRAQFEDFARLLAAPKAKGGGGYASAKWLALD